MKKKIVVFLTILFSLLCLGACNNASIGKEPIDGPQTPVTPSEKPQTGAPVFPENDFGKDNEVTYPNGWN